MVYPDVLAKWIHEVPKIAKGTSVDEVIKRMGEPDQDLLNFAPIFGPYQDRTLIYNVAMEINSAGVLVDIESIDLIFDLDNRYETFFVENPLHTKRFPDFLHDQDLTILMHAGPAASTCPTVSQPSP